MIAVSVTAKMEKEFCDITPDKPSPPGRRPTIVQTVLRSLLVQNYNLPGFTTYDAAAGIGKDQWTVQAYGRNLTDSRAILFSSYYEFIKADTVIRPRVAGVNFSWKF